MDQVLLPAAYSMYGLCPDQSCINLHVAGGHLPDAELGPRHDHDELFTSTAQGVTWCGFQSSQVRNWIWNF